VVDAYREVAPVAEDHGVLLCMENHSSVCRDADSLLWLIKAVGSECLVPNPDPTNFVPDYQVRGERAREAIYSETSKFAPGMANAHLKVADFKENGDHAYVDVPRLLDIFREAGYDGHLVLEYYGQDDPAEPCAKGVALLRRLFGKP
jgi:sugar phosphate isomerase/epimerase